MEAQEVDGMKLMFGFQSLLASCTRTGTDWSTTKKNRRRAWRSDSFGISHRDGGNWNRRTIRWSSMDLSGRRCRLIREGSFACNCRAVPCFVPDDRGRQRGNTGSSETRYVLRGRRGHPDGRGRVSCLYCRLRKRRTNTGIESSIRTKLQALGKEGNPSLQHLDVFVLVTQLFFE